jgi:DNA-binding NarL/FixJ family response regulator
MKKIKVLLADDHTIVLDGLKAVLKGNEALEVVGEVKNGEEVMAFLAAHHADVVVLDINMPVMDGINCARKLKLKYPQTRIIILTMYAQKAFLEEIVRIGVDGCLLKSNSGQELTEAIERVMDGKSYYDRIHAFVVEKDEAFQSKLSKREMEIVKLLAEGLTSIQIADKLFIAEHTVKTHRKNILRKTGVTNTSQLVQFALNNQLI